ncbi:hypothetical protein SASPL_100211 [Salvia splendens]|uniref:Uncharacterized protein n=1 Tax=Salvia splendens TaxID=180675 RepID=A0A8X8YPD0_SALSN|nr:hypothetical protein SASPL_100211 [Salvia splendens]
MAEMKISPCEQAEAGSFHQNFMRDEEERPKVAHGQFSDEIPVISFAGIEKGEEADRGGDLALDFFALPSKEKLRFKNADHQVAVNSKSSRLLIATFLNPAPNAQVYPLKIGEGDKAVMEEPITFMEMDVQEEDEQRSSPRST